MLKILDRYIIKKFLSTFFFALIVFTVIAVIIDLSANVEKFIEGEVTYRELFVDYYMNWSVWINGLLFPLYALITVIFFTSRMAYNSEIISILNAGISYRRLLRPYMFSALFLFTVHLSLNHFVIPFASQKHYTFQHKYIWKHNDKGKTADVHFFIAPDTKVYLENYNKKAKRASDFRIEKIVDNKLVFLLKAQSAEWIGEPNKWKISNYTTRTFNGLKEEFVDAQKSELDTTLNLRPKDFVRYVNQKEMMNTSELLVFLDEERSRGAGNIKRYEVELHRRSAEPFTILILTIIGFAVSSRKIRGGMGLQLAIGLVTGAAFIFISKFSSTFSTNDVLSPLVGAWVPNILFSLIAAFLVFRSRR